MMPKAGGQYVYLREAFSPLWGFLYGWTLSGDSDRHNCGSGRSWIRTIIIAARFCWASESNYIIAPIRFGGYALSLSTAQSSSAWRSLDFCIFHEHARFGNRQAYSKCFYDCKTGALFALIVLVFYSRVEVWCRRGKLQGLLDGAGGFANTLAQV